MLTPRPTISYTVRAALPSRGSWDVGTQIRYSAVQGQCPVAGPDLILERLRHEHRSPLWVDAVEKVSPMDQ